MTRIEKLIIVVTVVVLGIGSMALMWTSRQVGSVPPRAEEAAVVTEPVVVKREAPMVAPRPANVAPLPAAVAAQQQQQVQDTSAQQQVAPAAQVAAAPVSDVVQPTESEREQRNEAVRSLQAAEAQLATGNTDGIDALLSNTGEQLDEPARSAVSAARTALENKDLTLARAEVIRAIASSSTR